MPKTFTKMDLAGVIQKQNALTLHRSQELLETILEIIKDALGTGEEVLISGFGKFRVRRKSERTGRNPATGKAMILDKRKVVTFKCSEKLKEKINRS